MKSIPVVRRINVHDNAGPIPQLRSMVRSILSSLKCTIQQRSLEYEYEYEEDCDEVETFDDATNDASFDTTTAPMSLTAETSVVTTDIKAEPPISHTTVSLPIAFTSNSIKRLSKRKKKNRATAKRKKNKNNDKLLENAYNSLAEQNYYNYFDAVSGRYVLVTVLGVGPTLPAGKYAVVRYAGVSDEMQLDTIATTTAKVAASATPATLSFSSNQNGGAHQLRRFEVHRSELVPLSSSQSTSILQIMQQDESSVLKAGCPVNVHMKYWNQRFRLLSRFDEGVILDDESWYSITPEDIAEYVTIRCLNLSGGKGAPIRNVLDCFCGCGGNTIPFALRALGADKSKLSLKESRQRRFVTLVTSIDNDFEKLKRLKHNARIYGAGNSLDLICDDVYSYLQSMLSSSTVAALDHQLAMFFSPKALTTAADDDDATSEPSSDIDCAQDTNSRSSVQDDSKACGSASANGNADRIIVDEDTDDSSDEEVEKTESDGEFLLTAEEMEMVVSKDLNGGVCSRNHVRFDDSEEEETNNSSSSSNGIVAKHERVDSEYPHSVTQHTGDCILNTDETASSPSSETSTTTAPAVSAAISTRIISTAAVTSAMPGGDIDHAQGETESSSSISADCEVDQIAMDEDTDDSSDEEEEKTEGDGDLLLTAEDMEMVVSKDLNGGVCSRNHVRFDDSDEEEINNSSSSSNDIVAKQGRVDSEDPHIFMQHTADGVLDAEETESLSSSSSEALITAAASVPPSSRPTLSTAILRKLSLAQTPPAPMYDLIILSPPWGGPEYIYAEQYDLRTMLPCGCGYRLALLAAAASTNILYLLPKNTSVEQLSEIAVLIDRPCIIETVALNHADKLIAAYYGPMVKR